MAKKKSKRKSEKKSEKNSHVHSFQHFENPWIGSAKIEKVNELRSNPTIVVQSKKMRLPVWATQGLHPWQIEKLDQSTGVSVEMDGPKGKVVFVRLWAYDEPESDMKGLLAASDYALARNSVGEAMRTFLLSGVESIQVHLHDLNKEQRLGALVGAEMSAYRFRSWYEDKPLPSLIFSVGQGQLSIKDLKEAAHLGSAINLGRHVVNVPADTLTPKTFVDLVQRLFKQQSQMQVEVWDTQKLEQENMGLLLGVGKGAATGPYMVRLKYRPRGAQKKKLVAFVGKGITFDTGGLNIKPAHGMRIMKKDMGGSAAVLGLAFWAVHSGLKRNCDFYLALAENAVSRDAMRPSDILTSRLGKTVEIHNTDAEGRLAVADVLNVAVTQKGNDEPDTVIDVCTLTGAIKYGLGSELGGLFANNDALGEKILKGAHQRGDLLWRMPLYQYMRPRMNSVVADLLNSTDGFGGAVTASLFLQTFVGNKKWAHLDIYAWSDYATGAISEPGATGQAIQALSHFLNQ